MHGTIKIRMKYSMFFPEVVLLKKPDEIRAFLSPQNKQEENKHIKFPPKRHTAAELPWNIFLIAPKHALTHQHLHFKR
jgi:hypothetical protein